MRKLERTDVTHMSSTACDHAKESLDAGWRLLVQSVRLIICGCLVSVIFAASCLALRSSLCRVGRISRRIADKRSGGWRVYDIACSSSRGALTPDLTGNYRTCQAHHCRMIPVSMCVIAEGQKMMDMSVQKSTVSSPSALTRPTEAFISRLCCCETSSNRTLAEVRQNSRHVSKVTDLPTRCRWRLLQP